MKKSFLIIFLIGTFFTSFYAQKTTVNGFGHMDLIWEGHEDHIDAYMSLGEHALFINSNISERISFLGEATLKPSSSGFSVALERAWLKYSFGKGFNVIVGKMHTPVNYWNDVYNHARLFFPTIDRPTSFSYLIPVHTLGLRFQGQNLGKYKFGYDLVLANGMEASDTYAEGISPSYTAAFHFKPIDGMRVGASYHYENFSDASMIGSHAGHSHHSSGMNQYKGELDFHVASASIAHFGESFETLIEACYNANNTDSLGRADNFSLYTYLGKRIQEKHVPFINTDFISIDQNDLHSHPLNKFKLAIGYRYEFTPLCNIKIMAGYYFGFNQLPNPAADKFQFKTQFSYGI